MRFLNDLNKYSYPADMYSYTFFYYAYIETT